MHVRGSRGRTVCFQVPLPVQGPVLVPVAPISLCLHTTLSLVCAVNCVPHFIVWGAIQLKLSNCIKSVTQFLNELLTSVSLLNTYVHTSGGLKEPFHFLIYI